jgi:hypothetical protein
MLVERHPVQSDRNRSGAAILGPYDVFSSLSSALRPFSGVDWLIVLLSFCFEFRAWILIGELICEVCSAL